MDDFRALYSIQHSLRTIQTLIDDHQNPSRNALADVWNALLDARSSIVNKLFDDEVMNYAHLDEDITMILAKKREKSHKEK